MHEWLRCPRASLHGRPGETIAAWREREKVGIGSVDWDREYELSWVIKAGRSVYTDFSHSMHRFGPTTIRGDIGLPGDDAVFVSATISDPRLTEWPRRSISLKRGLSPCLDNRRSLLRKSHRRRISRHGRHTLSNSGAGEFPIHVVDPTAIENMTRIEEKACADLMRLRFGEPIPGERSFIKRRKSVEDLLSDFRKAVPSYNVHERCTMHIEGFEGGYYYKQLPASYGRRLLCNTSQKWLLRYTRRLPIRGSVAQGLVAPPPKVNETRG